MTAREQRQAINAQQTELEQRIDLARRAVTAADVHLVEVPAMEAEAALGERDADEVEAYAVRYREHREAAEREIRSCEQALDVLAGRVAVVTARAAAEELDALLPEIDEAVAKREKVEKALAGSTAAVVRDARAHSACRDHEAQLLAEAARVAAAAGVEPPEPVDETDWLPDFDAFRGAVVHVTRGPLKPATDSAAAAERDVVSAEQAVRAREELPGRIVEEILLQHRSRELPATLAELDALDRPMSGGLVDGHAANLKGALLSKLAPLTPEKCEWVLGEVNARRAAGRARYDAEVAAAQEAAAGSGPFLAPEPGAAGAPLVRAREVS